MNTELTQLRGSSLSPILVGGFLATAIMGTSWVITHLPWLGLQQQVAIPIILACWFLPLAAVASRVGRDRSTTVGLGAGVVSGLTGLVFFGTRLGTDSQTTTTSPGVVPNAALLAVGFVVLSITIGLLAGIVGRLISAKQTTSQSTHYWLARFAMVTVVAALPLIFIGGLVTSTNSGMAVPDWPRTYGANMFLYQLGSHSEPGKYVEHAHRLFGAFVGLSSLVLLIWVFACDRRKWVRVLVLVAFLFVCSQGVLGGLRVALQTHYSPLDPSKADRIGRLFALAHGVFGQLTIGLLATLPVVLSLTFRSLTPSQKLLEPALARRIKFLCTLTLHALLLQLLLGAWYRHFHSKHVLYTHIALSIFVFIGAALAGFTLQSEKARQSIVGPVVARLGHALGLVVTIQFLLGWIAFAVAGLTPDPTSIPEALTRTAHQANGGILIALAAACYVWGRRIGRSAAPQSMPTPATV